MRNLPFVIAILLIGALVTLAVLYAANVVRLPNGNGNAGLRTTPTAYNPDEPFMGETRPGEVALIVSRVDIPAYTRITREHVVSPRTLRPSVVFLEQSRVEPDMLKTFAEVSGRVLATNKSAGTVFRDGEFLPSGTRAGIVAGIPAGKRAVVVEANRVRGSFSLNLGDSFDLVTMTPEIEAMFPIGPDGKPIVSSPAALRRQLQDARLRPALLVSDAKVVRPVTARQEFFERRAGLVGGRVDISTKPVEEFTFSMNVNEVGGVLKALTEGRMILAVARSGRIDEIGVELPLDYIEQRPRTPVFEQVVQAIEEREVEEARAPQPTVIELVVGNQVRQMLFAPEDSR